MIEKVFTLDSRIAPHTTPKPHFLENLAKKALLHRLSQLKHGEIILEDGETQLTFGQPTPRCPVRLTLIVHHPRFYSDIAFGGTIGGGEAFMSGYWETSDLTGLVRILICNREVLDGMDGGWAKLTAPLQKFLHRVNRNSADGSRRNISAHYDIGNDFFSLFLDQSMMYSNAIFTNPTMSLHEAQLNRLDIVCRKLDLQPTDHLLEIGAGWGGLSIYAAKHFGCRVTTTTISREQYDFACERIAAENLADRITILLDDYRDLTGQYDKLVSLEMIEAVGHEYYDVYFKKCSDLLEPDGLMVLQAITIADQRYEVAKRSVDFIQRYIFPGGCIPSVAAMSDSIARVTDMRLFHLEDIGPHYVTTLRAWLNNLQGNQAKIQSLGYSEEFIRMWEFYFCYCEGGFMERVISNVHMVFAKPINRRPSLTSV